MFTTAATTGAEEDHDQQQFAHDGGFLCERAHYRRFSGKLQGLTYAQVAGCHSVE
ncbi:MAG: hypothetical protein WBN34_11100 [Woeseia sp.]